MISAEAPVLFARACEFFIQVGAGWVVQGWCRGGARVAQGWGGAGPGGAGRMETPEQQWQLLHDWP